MDYPINHNKIKFYNYRFFGIEKPIVIEARNRKQAREKLNQIYSTLPEPYLKSKIVGESVIVPLTGISEKKIKGRKHLWVGEAVTPTGWMEETEYNIRFGSKAKS